MAAEFVVVNPRRKHRRRKARARKVTNRRRRRHVVRHHNPVRRLRRSRRRASARRSRRRTHRNPGIGRGVMGVAMEGAKIGAGAVITNLGAGFISKHLPAQFQTGLGNTAVKAGVGLVVLPMLLKFVPGGAKFIRPVMIGAGVAVLFDLWTAYAEAPVKKALGLSDYQPGYLSDYHTGQLAGDLSMDAQLSGTIYEGGVYD